MKDQDILSAVTNQLSLASSEPNDGTISNEKALGYYLGLPDGKEVEGRSQVTSTDVADAIEWIMPQVMKAFTQTHEVVTFDPVHSGDELQAELETQYTYEVLMKQNKGFIAIHTFVKDALMQRLGILKVFVEEDTQTDTQEFSGVSEEEIQALLMSEGTDILAMSPTKLMDPMTGQEIVTYEVRVAYTKVHKRIVVDTVPPEQFRVSSNHNSIDVCSAPFSAQVFHLTGSELLNLGISKKVIEELAPGDDDDDTSYRFEMQGESTNNTWVDDQFATKEFEVAECYMQLDVNEDGHAEYVKVLVAGGDSPTHVLIVDEIDSPPWITTTAILMSHKMKGMSITDRLKEIQDQKTTLWRNMFDNMYLQNNQRNAVVENQVNLDDLLVSRPGGIVRVKRLDAIQPLATPQMGADAYNMMKYLDEVKAGRTGVSADGPVAPQNIGDNVGSEGLEKLMTAKEELVGLVVRVIAETGIKPLCVRIRDLACKHLDTIHDFKFRGVWKKVQPSKWMERTSCTVRVGTGSGDRRQQLVALTQVLTIQEKALANPGQALVTESKVYSTLDDFCKFAGLNGANKYFVDPESDEGKQLRKNIDESQKTAKEKSDKTEAIMLEAQVKVAKAEKEKSEAQIINTQLKHNVDMQKNEIQSLKQAHESELASVKLQLEELRIMSDGQKQNDELTFKYWDATNRHSIEMARVEKDAEKQLNADISANKGTLNE